MRRHYYAAISWMDELVGDVVSTQHVASVPPVLWNDCIHAMFTSYALTIQLFMCADVRTVYLHELCS